MPSIVIAAHNEEDSINRCVQALLEQDGVEPSSIVVVANGCTDRTAEMAAAPGVQVISRPEPGKAGALNMGDTLARGFPRIYLDADIVLPNNALAAIEAEFRSSRRPLAVVPRRRVNSSGRPWLVRAHTAIAERLPAFRHSLFGRGTIAVSEEGRSRFVAFPELIADDLFLDSHFADHEKAVADDVAVTVEAPRSTAELLGRLVRVRRGNAELRAAGRSGEIPARIRPANRLAWFRDVVLPEPRLALAGVAYAGLNIWAAILARRTPKTGTEWGRKAGIRETSPRREAN